MCSAGFGRLSVVKVLLAAGADHAAKDKVYTIQSPLICQLYHHYYCRFCILSTNDVYYVCIFSMVALLFTVLLKAAALK